MSDRPPDLRQSGERRRYNRRAPASSAPPPYYETFDRIAVALEDIEALLEVMLQAMDRGAGGGGPDRDERRR